MKKALLVTTVSGFVPQFERNNVKLLQNLGYEIHYASNYHTPSYGNDNSRLDDMGIIRHQIDFVRSPYKLLDNWKAYCQLKDVMKQDKYDLVHCHTPMGGVLARLAAYKTHTAPVIYTAHGFHFYKGAPKKNWLFYYPVEKFLSRYTYQQICLNKEDFEIARKKFKAEYVDYIPGVGIDLEKFQNLAVDRESKIKELGLPKNKKILLSVGELIKRKNHETIIRAIAELQDPALIYVICGHGELEEYLKELCKRLKVDDQIYFLGYRTDILEIYPIADLFIFPSWQEGLPVALLEAMASGLPAICSDIRGNRDLIQESSCLMKENTPEEYQYAIKKLLKSEETMKKLGKINKAAANDFSQDKVKKIMLNIYKRADGK